MNRVDPPSASGTPSVHRRRDLACRLPAVDPAWFFPGPGDRARQAREVCEQCPAQEECLAWMLATRQQYGVWGGTLPEDRGRLLKATS